MAIKIALDGSRPGEYFVWAMLDDADFNDVPENRGESFIIGAGETAAIAVANAKRELEDALGQLEVITHDAGVPIDRRRSMTPHRGDWLFIDERGDSWLLSVNQGYDGRTLPLKVMLLERAK